MNKKPALKKSKKYIRKPVPALAFVLLFAVFVLIAAVVYVAINNKSKITFAATTVTNTVDQLIATRPDHANPHAVRLPLPMYDWSWGKHGTEDNKSHGSGSINLWLAMLYDQSNVNHNPNVKLNIRRMYGYSLNGGTWTKIYDGLPTWSVTTPDTGGGYVDISPTTESDGSYSYTVPMNLMMHMSTPAPGLQISGSQGVVSVVEARLLGTASDISASKLALSAGADFRDSSGSGGSITQSGFGQGGLLTGDWQAYDMISTTLTDAQIAANPPPGFSTAPISSSPAPTSSPVVQLTPTPTPLPSQPPVVTSGGLVIEAEKFSVQSGYVDSAGNVFSDSAASGGQGLVLYSNGSAAINTTSGFSGLVVRVKADVCKGGPKLTIKVDGNTLYSKTYGNTAWSDVIVNFNAVAGLTHTISLGMSNDSYKSKTCDRNLRFDKVTLQ